jgi:hypothetical protein
MRVPRRNGTRNEGEGRTPAVRQRKSIEQLAAEQGVNPTRLEDILGKGANLWKSDQQLEQFIEDIYARRREDRELTRQ